METSRVMFSRRLPSDHRSKETSRRHAFPRLTSVVIALSLLTMAAVLLLRGKTSKGMCSYDPGSKRATCKVKNLECIPDDIPTNAEILVFGSKLDKSENSFTVLEPANFSRFGAVHDLQLVKCGVHEIRPDTFGRLGSLRRLDLRYNRIQTVSELTFRGLKSLDYLYLSNNPVTQLNDFTFRGMRIENLILANNPTLSHVSSKALAGAIVHSLVLNRCSLTELPTETLWHVGDSLQELHLTNNMQPLQLPDAIFKGLRLRVLNLDGNGLGDADFLGDVEAEEISLDDNPLEEVDFGDSPKLLAVRRLSLGNVRLSAVSPADFAMLTNLEELDLEQNQLRALNASVFGELTSLKIVDVSGNAISAVEGDFERHLPALRSLFLDDNDLQVLPPALGPFFSRLDTLTLHNNPLHCNCEMRWLRRWLAAHPGVLQSRSSLRCATPEPVNFTQADDDDFRCRRPVILNATLHSDGVSLVCTAEGDPPPVVSWLGAHAAATAPPSAFDRRNLENKCTIAVSRENNYTCTASNLAGNDSVVVDTKKIPTSGLKFVYQSQEIEILETPQGLFITALLLVILGYIFRQSS